jgi:hypothetical protein
VPTPDSARLERAQRARERLARVVGGDPHVTGVDIGAEPAPVGEPTVVLRVHVSRRAPPGKPAIPKQVDGFPVRIVPADYRLE